MVRLHQSWLSRQRTPVGTYRVSILQAGQFGEAFDGPEPRFGSGRSTDQFDAMRTARANAVSRPRLKIGRSGRHDDIWRDPGGRLRRVGPIGDQRQIDLYARSRQSDDEERTPVNAATVAAGLLANERSQPMTLQSALAPCFIRRKRTDGRQKRLPPPNRTAASRSLAAEAPTTRAPFEGQSGRCYAANDAVDDDLRRRCACRPRKPGRQVAQSAWRQRCADRICRRSNDLPDSSPVHEACQRASVAAGAHAVDRATLRTLGDLISSRSWCTALSRRTGSAG